MPSAVYELLGIAIVYGIYTLFCLGFMAALRKMRVSSKIRVFLSILILGVITGFAVFSLWPGDIIVILNIPAVLIGDGVYIWSIKQMGDPSSFQAHYTIPWLLRIPQVYVIVSVVFWGLVGLVVQLVHNRKAEIGRFMRRHQPQPRLKGYNA